MAPKAKPLEERLWAKVSKTESCWLWTGYLDKNGYGRISVGHSHNLKPHRVAYELEHGPIQPGIHLDHICHTPACIRPSHLRPVNHKENQENRVGARRDSGTGVRGVSLDPRNGRWRTRLRHGGKRITCGSFDTLEEAEAAVIAKRLELFTHNDLDRAA